MCELTAGDFDRADLSAMINVPLSDNPCIFRAQGGSLSQDGYVHARLAGARRIGGHARAPAARVRAERRSRPSRSA